MSIALYMDVHVREAVTLELRRRGVDVLMAKEDNANKFEDAMLLDRAIELGRVLFTQDDDFLAEAKERNQRAESFAGVIYAHQQDITTGQTIRDLQLMAEVYEPEDMLDRVEFLPL